jgi:hypothetical protein
LFLGDPAKNPLEPSPEPNSEDTKKEEVFKPLLPSDSSLIQLSKLYTLMSFSKRNVITPSNFRKTIPPFFKNF